MLVASAVLVRGGGYTKVTMGGWYGRENHALKYVSTDAVWYSSGRFAGFWSAIHLANVIPGRLFAPIL